MKNKRIHTRSLCADLVRLEWFDGERTSETAALLEDISHRGACLQTEVPVPAGIVATVRNGENWSLPCRTAYCVYREIGYFVGLEFDEDVSWSKRSFQPRHLLDLSDLAIGSRAD
jgi:hypothetical protein